MPLTAARQSTYPRAWAEIDLQALRANVSSLTGFLGPDRRLMAVVKADAYGHGLLPVAQSALEAGAEWLGIATVVEGISLRSAGVSAPIALLCAPAPGEAPEIVAHRLTPVVGDADLVTALSGAAGNDVLEVHLDIDTGMGRSGVLPGNAARLLRRCRDSGLLVTGLCTHFADAEGPDARLTRLQWQRFAEARQALEEAGAAFAWVHAGNSAATLRFAPRGCNLVRPGLLLYGLRPGVPTGNEQIPPDGRVSAAAEASPEQSLTWPEVRPALALKARVGSVRDLPAGHTVSYGATCRLGRRSRVATILIGYGDGYPRRLSNCGDMLVHGRRAPILGRVCMDQTVVDVTDIPEVASGDIVTCIGTDGSETITAEAIARRIDATEHEITTCLTARLPRAYF